MAIGLAAALGCLPACAPDQRPELPARAGQVPSLVPILDPEGAALGVGAILRTTARSAVLLASPCPARGLPDELVIALGADRIAVVRQGGRALGPDHRGGLALLDVPRGDHDLRPIGPAAIPPLGEPVAGHRLSRIAGQLRRRA